VRAGEIRRRAERSRVEVVGQGLVEVEFRDGVGIGGVEGGRLIEEPREEIALGRSAGGREGRGCVGEALTPRNVRCAGAPVRGRGGWPRRREDRSEPSEASSPKANARIFISALGTAVGPTFGGCPGFREAVEEAALR